MPPCNTIVLHSILPYLIKTYNEQAVKFALYVFIFLADTSKFMVQQIHKFEAYRHPLQHKDGIFIHK